MSNRGLRLAVVALLSSVAIILFPATGQAVTKSKVTHETFPSGWALTTLKSGRIRIWTRSVPAENGTSSLVRVRFNRKTFALGLMVRTGQLATDKCVTAYFDWASRGHHDARALRDCQSNSSVTYWFKDSNTGNLERPGHANRLGACYAANGKTTSCYIVVGTIGKDPFPPMNYSPWPNPARATPCDLSWVERRSNGTMTSFIDHHSRRNNWVSATSC